MRISDWSSDVCSSDLVDEDVRELLPRKVEYVAHLFRADRFQRDDVRRRGDHVKPRWVFGRGGAKQGTIGPRTGCDHIGDGKGGRQAEIKRSVAELQVEIQQAGLAASDALPCCKQTDRKSTRLNSSH